ncbi:sensor histidine kinase [Undibacterium pigrum]|uniref:Signal transduction histidine kinase n=1 Tax=Undibacterium pigrum TaxID=401470 RepID=A0A318JUX9_9BURK|nr:sensor histidine kinase [Undibacterium pigrum]PXX44268.1 signal transduction histidine kinase [Undibacterium pigrum]
MSKNKIPEQESTPTTVQLEPAHLTIDAHVVVQLGAELITDPEQALLELLKNSYDADASWCNVIIDTVFEESEDPENGNGKSLPTLKGIISIEDNGHGMAAEQIRQGWLSISLSLKREAKRQGTVTPKYKRFPMGDKGLGRVSSMRLGDLLRVTTHSSENEPGTQVWFKWSDCKSGLPLDKVPVGERKVDPIGRTGTKVEIIGLHDFAHWQHEEAREKLQAKMSCMVSPFNQFENFLPAIEVDGAPIDLVDLNSQVLSVAISHFKCDWKEKKIDPLNAERISGAITMNAQVRLDFFKGKDTEAFETHVISDSGEKLLAFLEKEGFVSQYDSLKRGKDGWFIDFEMNVDDVDIPWGGTAKRGRRAQKTGENKQSTLFASKAEYPGPFNSELYGYSYDDQVFQNILAGSTVSKQFVQELSGVAIFRDRFRVRTGNDWLRLADSFTSGSSYYGLRPKNVLGFVAITTENNSQLKETSNRENFVDNNEWKTFYTLMLYFRDFANQTLENLRRAYSRFLTKQAEADGVIVTPSTEQALNHIVDLERATVTQKIKREEHRDAAMATFDATKQALAKISSEIANPKTAALALELQDHLTQLKNHIEVGLSEPPQLVEQQTNASSAAEVIKERFSQVEGQIEEVYEHVATGLVAQGVVHDVHGLIEEILSRLTRIENIKPDAHPTNRALARELSATKTLVRLIGKQLGTLNPMLRQYREKKESISIVEFISEFFELRSARYKELGIQVFPPEKQSNFSATINRGRLTQVFDNLARNSEYWLMDNLGRDFKVTPEVHVELSGTVISFWDSGRGVRPAMEKTLFDLFVTDKPREQGQGLGLFIVRELLKFENCSISLGRERNSYGRRFKFYVDLCGVADGNK